MDFLVIVVKRLAAGRAHRKPWPRRSPRRWSASLERIAGVNEMTSSSSLGSTRIILEFNFDRDIQRRGARRAGGHQRRAKPAAERDAELPDLPQGQPVRCADHDPRR